MLILFQPTENADVFEVELCKDNKGLGITIAGYVGEENEGKDKVIPLNTFH